MRSPINLTPKSLEMSRSNAQRELLGTKTDGTDTRCPGHDILLSQPHSEDLVRQVVACSPFWFPHFILLSSSI